MPDNISILIVDNSNEFATLFKSRLNLYNGIKVLPIASSAADALLLLQNYAVDVLLLDIVMPGMDGLQLLEKINEMNFDPLVIVVSALSTNAIVKKALELGASCCFDKPIDCDKLILKIHQLINHSNSNHSSML